MTPIIIKVSNVRNYLIKRKRHQLIGMYPSYQVSSRRHEFKLTELYNNKDPCCPSTVDLYKFNVIFCYYYNNYYLLRHSNGFLLDLFRIYSHIVYRPAELMARKEYNVKHHFNGFHTTTIYSILDVIIIFPAAFENLNRKYKKKGFPRVSVLCVCLFCLDLVDPKTPRPSLSSLSFMYNLFMSYDDE